MLQNHPFSLDYKTSSTELPDREAGPAFYYLRCVSRGALPWRDPKTKEMSFPDDEQAREYWVTGWEILAARETGAISDEWIIEVTYYDELISFRDYIEYFYSKRQQAQATKDKAGDLFSKLLMNSLYGKFGANPEQYEDHVIIPRKEARELIETDYRDAGEFGPWTLASKPLDEDAQRFYNVATSASITGYARAHLWRAICVAGRDKMLYCDTDSIACEGDPHALDTGPRLGQWKHEGDFDKAGIAGKKLYIFRGRKKGKTARANKSASKGVKLTDAELWRVAAGGEVVYHPDVPTFSVHSAPRFTSRRIVMRRK